MANYKLTDDAREDLRELKAFSLRQFGNTWLVCVPLCSIWLICRGWALMKLKV